MNQSYFWVVGYDDKSPVLYGPYPDYSEAHRKMTDITSYGRGEIVELDTPNRAKATREVKERMSNGDIYLPRFTHVRK